MQKGDPPIIVEQTFQKSSAVVWAAITEVEQMRQWFFDTIPAFEPVVGFQTRFNVNTGERDFLHIWTITSAETEKHITYNWEYDVYPGAAVVTFTLKALDADSTKLTIVAEVLETFPQDIPEFKRESGVAGWQYFIQQSLARFLA